MGEKPTPKEAMNEADSGTATDQETSAQEGGVVINAVGDPPHTVRTPEGISVGSAVFEDEEGKEVKRVPIKVRTISPQEAAARRGETDE